MDCIIAKVLKLDMYGNNIFMMHHSSLSHIPFLLCSDQETFKMFAHNFPKIINKNLFHMKGIWCFGVPWKFSLVKCTVFLSSVKLLLMCYKEKILFEYVKIYWIQYLLMIENDDDLNSNNCYYQIYISKILKYNFLSVSSRKRESVVISA